MYYILKLRNRFQKFALGTNDKFGNLSSDINKHIEDVGGYTIKVYDLTSRRFKENRDVTTTILYRILFLDFIFSTFYTFCRILIFVNSCYPKQKIFYLNRLKERKYNNRILKGLAMKSLASPLKLPEKKEKKSFISRFLAFMRGPR
jgi:hypothetical protein